MDFQQSQERSPNNRNRNKSQANNFQLEINSINPTNLNSPHNGDEYSPSLDNNDIMRQNTNSPNKIIHIKLINENPNSQS